MDIRANMAEQLRIAAEIIQIENGDDDDKWADQMAELGVRLAELVQAADAWLKAGHKD